MARSILKSDVAVR